ncbi:hypothetical protein DB88DRAFT_533845 [Papiliotrema laurentii]|uniref:Vacuolar protein sorting-associated protein 27 n=1 Tax=Papiliotrema laurentii TaxID=5418 RepID=A0AAD9L8K8_PAPLA|nr:hypothetical protein DB88DRAFT_533845 [Papiliotrema laurentii]
MSWIWGTATNPQYEELVEKACSPLNLPYPQSEDMATNLEITDLIRSKAVQPKLAMQSLKKRVASKNGRVQMYALGLVDTCIKNGGDHFLAEIASKEFVDEMSGLIKSSATGAEVKQMALRLFQSWAIAFKSKPELSFFVDVYNELKNSGVQFPPPPSETSSHLLTTTTAPAWVDSDTCMRCRAAFTFTNRKHHCRNCGLVFDQACSSKTMPLPRYGIMEEVRVCEGCWTKSGKGKSQVPAGPPPAVPGRTPRSRQDLDADLQRAIELSLAEAQPGGSGFVGSEPPLRKAGANTVEDDDEELRLAIEASLKDMERARPSAPAGSDDVEYKPLPTFDLSARESETILTFSNTMDQMAAYGERDLRRFPYAHVLAEQAYALGGKLQRNAEEKTTKQQMLAEMQSKLSQAVSMYGQILDEQQQRQYAQHQQYAAQPAYAYNPYMNGHASPYPTYIPPQHAPIPQSQPQPTAAPSLYPAMPDFAAQPVSNPYQPAVAPHAFSPAPSQPYPQQSQPNPWAPSQPSEATYQPSQAAHSPSQPQRQGSMSYASPAPMEASAPPPVDLASHPSSSPTRSISNLPIQPSAPARSASYASASPIATASAPLATSPQASVPIHQPYAQATPQQPQYSAPPQQPEAQHVYSANSFPQAPAAVFPDAPSAEPQGLEKQEREEALLIEL